MEQRLCREYFDESPALVKRHRKFNTETYTVSTIEVCGRV